MENCETNIQLNHNINSFKQNYYDKIQYYRELVAQAKNMRELVDILQNKKNICYNKNNEKF